MKKTGEFLRKAREDKGLSVHEIGLSLKINPKILKQIEEGDKDNLPAKTFLRGFVQSYALFLKIDPNEVLKIFSDEMGTTKPHQISLASGPQIKGSGIDIDDPENKDDLGIKRTTGKNFSKENFEFKNIGIGIVVFILLLSLIAVRKVVEKYQKEAEVDVVKTEESLKSNSKLELPQAPPASTPLPTTDTKTVAQPSTATAESVQQNAPTTSNLPASNQTNTHVQAGAPQAVNVDAQKPVVKPSPQLPSATTAPATLNKPTTTAPTAPVSNPTASNNTVVAAKPVTPPPAPTTNKPVVATTNDETKKPAQPAPTPQPTATTTTSPKSVVLETTPIPATAPKEEPKPPKNIELVIEAYETVEIEMIQSTGKVEKIKMSPSQIQTFKTVSGVKLNISNGGAVNLIVNGKDIGVPGDLGKPKRVSF